VKPERWEQIRKVLDAALDLAPEARLHYVAQACAGDPDLSREVTSLLAAHNKAGESFLEKPALQTMMISSGTKLGTYEVIGMLGAGGMGEVYRAQDSVLGREVAIKVLPAIFSSDRDRLRRFEQEARAAAALNHPNILSVYQFGVQDGFPYVVSELLQGETLRSRLQQEALPVGDAVPCALQLARGLAAAHAKGIIHRDLKPENLFITRDGWLKILDFGLAKLLPAADSGAAGPETTLASGTMPGMLLGTVGYMSPEQARGQEVDARSDIFSLGAIFYELLSGQRAFDGPTSADVLSAILKHDRPPMGGNNQDIADP
jgi:serine/threonine protein kinase